MQSGLNILGNVQDVGFDLVGGGGDVRYGRLLDERGDLHFRHAQSFFHRRAIFNGLFAHKFTSLTKYFSCLKSR